MNQRIVCWIGDAPNHRALVGEISKRFNVVGVVIDKKTKTKSPGSSTSFFSKLIDKIRFGKIDRAWKQMQQYYCANDSKLPETPAITVDNINNSETLAFTQQAKPVLVVVSGTSMIKEPLVSLSLPIGIMNLHTGLSPYVKGGPNCTNWCIANNKWGWIGSTVLWISAGIDSGNIITTEPIDVSDETDLTAIHLKVMKHAHGLYLRAIDYVLKNPPPHQSIPQASLGKGNLYLSKMWTSDKKKQLLRNLAVTRNRELPAGTRIIPLPS